MAQKTVGLVEPMRDALGPLAPKIHAAFVYGSVAKREETAYRDIDLVVLSDSPRYGEPHRVSRRPECVL